ncbi:MAG: hypothetical protein JSV57_05065 [Candidatus Bathyarchaeota archaeon]|nr:MAG: hypothetical protein JSV57_05065 [Candidatus Bathyarchaeota archaeon]
MTSRNLSIRTVCILLASAILLTVSISYLVLTYYDGDRRIDYWISPCADEWIPLAFRLERTGLIYYDDPYIICRVMNTSTNVYASWLGWGRLYGFGVYEWKGKIENPGANRVIIPGGFERHHGWALEGTIHPYNTGGIYKFRTCREDGVMEQTNLTGQDWTVETTFKIEWTSNHVRFFVDGTLEATHTLAVPQSQMQLFAEAGVAGSLPTKEPICYFRERSFRQLD